MASAANPNKKELRNTAAAPSQFCRRERSFVIQRPSQPAGSNHFQQRERSFIRDGSRPGNFQNFGGGNKSGNQQQSRAQPNGGAARGKPNMEIYRPPSLRSGEAPAAVQPFSRVQFQSNDVDHGPRLTKSRTSLELNNTTARNNKLAQQQQEQQQQQPDQSVASKPISSHFSLQRSKSIGSQNVQKASPSISPVEGTAAAAQVATAVPLPKASSGELPDVSQFPEQAQTLLCKIASDPDKAASRLVMEAVRTIINRVIESSRYASPIARYCSYVIEKENKETFLESLLNTCQESFQERDRLLRSSNGSSQRWVAFINFLNEMYLQLKRRNTKSKVGSRPPELILLALLAESCCVTLKQPSSQSLQELECLFFVLTGIGRDVESELPGKMASIFNLIRDAFLEMNSLPGAAQRTLLQLIELRAAKWQLPATAVTYYYPSVSGSSY